MSDRIELTDEELAEAVKIMRGMEYGLVPMGGGILQRDGSTLCHMNDRGAAKAIRMAIGAINRVRAGEPVGTIRNSGVRAEIYIRDENPGGRYWRVYGYAGRQTALDFNTDLLYTPEES